MSSAPRGYTGNLASVHNATTNTFVANLAPGRAWLGGYQTGNGEEEPWLWSDGSTWDYENWNAGEPSNDYGLGNYMEVNFGGQGTWNDLPVEKSIEVPGYVCQYEGKVHYLIDSLVIKSILYAQF